jgi:hypothetical protein
MKRARSVLAVVCLGLGVLVVAAWVRGYFVSETIGFGVPKSDGKMAAGGFVSGRGGLGFVAVVGMSYEKEIDGPFYQREPTGYAGGIGSIPARWAALGFMYAPLPTTPGGHGWAVAAPLWFLLLILVPWPAWHIRTALRDNPERRRRRGLCVRCGYDLRASAERCPECGTDRVQSAA